MSSRTWMIQKDGSRWGVYACVMAVLWPLPTPSLASRVACCFRRSPRTNPGARSSFCTFSLPQRPTCSCRGATRSAPATRRTPSTPGWGVACPRPPAFLSSPRASHPGSTAVHLASLVRLPSVIHYLCLGQHSPSVLFKELYLFSKK